MAMLLLLLFCTALCAVQGQKSWTSLQYPDPDINPEMCSRPKKSRVCDPDGILSVKDADHLDVLIDEVYNTTACPCNAEDCKRKKAGKRGGSGGYEIGIALMKRMDRGQDAPVHVHHVLSDAFAFSSDIYYKWKLAKCHEAIIITISVDDSVVYAVTGDRARAKVSDEDVMSTLRSVKRYFLKNGDIASGLRKMISDFKRELQKQDDSRKKRAIEPPKPDTVAGQGMMVSSVSTTTSSILVLSLSMLAAFKKI